MTDAKDRKKVLYTDLKSIEEIFSATWESLYRFIYFKVQNREEAEDITQETYVRALPHFQKNLVKPDKYIGFLKTIALNVLRDKWRKSKRQGVAVNLETINPEETALEDHTEASAQRELIKKALNSLNEEQRTIVQLRIIEGYSVSETAKITGKKEATVRVLQYRALKALTGILGNSLDYI